MTTVTSSCIVHLHNSAIIARLKALRFVGGPKGIGHSLYSEQETRKLLSSSSFKTTTKSRIWNLSPRFSLSCFFHSYNGRDIEANTENSLVSVSPRNKLGIIWKKINKKINKLNKQKSCGQLLSFHLLEPADIQQIWVKSAQPSPTRGSQISVERSKDGVPRACWTNEHTNSLFWLAHW